MNIKNFKSYKLIHILIGVIMMSCLTLKKIFFKADIVRKNALSLPASALMEMIKNIFLT